MRVQKVGVVNPISFVSIMVEVVVPMTLLHVDVVFNGQESFWLSFEPILATLHQPDLIGQFVFDVLFPIRTLDITESPAFWILLTGAIDLSISRGT